MSGTTRSVRTSSAPARVFDYLSDYSTCTDWDPHTVSCRRLDEGTVGLGSRFEVTRVLLEQTMTLACSITAFDSPSRVVFEGGNDLVSTHEELDLAPADRGGTQVSWSVDVQLHGPAKVAQPVLGAVIGSVADDATDSLREHLDALA